MRDTTIVVRGKKSWLVGVREIAPFVAGGYPRIFAPGSRVSFFKAAAIDAASKDFTKNSFTVKFGGSSSFSHQALSAGSCIEAAISKKVMSVVVSIFCQG